MNETYALLVGLGILIVFFVIRGINRSKSRQQESTQVSEIGSFNATIANELSRGIDGKSLIEILGLENLPADGQKEIIEAATSVIEKRCLNHILESLNKQEKQDFIDILDEGSPEVVQNFLKSKRLDPSSILREEVLRFKEETADKFS